MPNADTDLHGPRSRTDHGGEGIFGEADEIGRNGAGHLAQAAFGAAVDEDAIGREHGRKQEGSGLLAGGNDDCEAVPGKAAEAGIALVGPGAVAAQGGPGGVVEAGAGPERSAVDHGRVAGVEAPEAVEGNHGLAVVGEVEGLGGERAGAQSKNGGEGRDGELSEACAGEHEQYIPQGVAGSFRFALMLTQPKDIRAGNRIGMAPWGRV